MMHRFLVTRCTLFAHTVALSREQVLEERDASPRTTRSASKKKQRLPPFSHANNDNGVVLMFSPPNQQANRRREQEALEQKQREIAQRVVDARVSGQVQIFSPNGTHSTWSGERREEPMDEGQVCLQLSPGNDSKPAAKEEQYSADNNNNKVASQLEDIRETVNKLLEKENQSVSADLLQMERKALDEQIMRNQQLSASNDKLETSNEHLRREVKDLETKSAYDKESFLVENTRLEGELGASKREALIQIQGLEESRTLLASQLKAALQDKTATMLRVAELENEISIIREKNQELKHKSESLRSEAKREKDLLTQESEKLAGVNGQLSSELEAVKKARDDLKVQIDEYEGALDSLENQLLPESEAQLKAALENLRIQKEATKKAKDKLTETNALIEKMKAEIEISEKDKEEERFQFQKLNEESSKAFEKMTNEASEKQEKIDSLAQQLNDIQEDLANEKASSHDLKQQIEAVKQEMDDCVEKLERSSHELENKLQKAETDKAVLEEKLAAAMNQVSELLNAKKDALTECSTKSATLQEIETALVEERVTNKRLQNEGRDRQLRINELEKCLKTAVEERDDARNRMDTFDVREEDLYRKLRESDRIRRDLHNRVMQLSGNIRVYVRVRPPLPGELENLRESRKRKVDEMLEEENPFHFPGVFDRSSPTSADSASTKSVDDLTKNIVEVTEPYKDRGGLNPRRKKWRFGFDHVFSPNQGQEDVWEATEPLVQSAIDGFNVCIFAYGQTGSGKTYTMLGEPSNEGLIARSVSKLFEAKHEMEALSRRETKVDLSVELLEIYNEQVRDLLAPNSGPSGCEINLKVTSTEVIGNIVVPTGTKDEVMHVLHKAQKRRCVKATNSNSESSRSHMLFTIHFSVETKDGVSRAGKLHICDLAGSERLNKSGANSIVGVSFNHTCRLFVSNDFLLVLLIDLSTSFRGVY
jgi:kinesin family protein C1